MLIDCSLRMRVKRKTSPDLPNSYLTIPAYESHYYEDSIYDKITELYIFRINEDGDEAETLSTLVVDTSNENQEYYISFCGVTYIYIVSTGCIYSAQTRINI